MPLNKPRFKPVLLEYPYLHHRQCFMLPSAHARGTLLKGQRYLRAAQPTQPISDLGRSRLFTSETGVVTPEVPAHMSSRPYTALLRRAHRGGGTPCSSSSRSRRLNISSGYCFALLFTWGVFHIGGFLASFLGGGGNRTGSRHGVALLHTGVAAQSWS